MAQASDCGTVEVLTLFEKWRRNIKELTPIGRRRGVREIVRLKHYMNTSWMSLLIPIARRSAHALFGGFFDPAFKEGDFTAQNTVNARKSAPPMTYSAGCEPVWQQQAF